MSGASDVDLVVVHPVGQEHAALAARSNLVAQAVSVGAVADVTLLSEREVFSTRFWDAENVVLLDQAIVECLRSDPGPRLTENV